MAISSVKHLPIYKFDTMAELENFKHSFGETHDMDSSYSEIPSFNDNTAEYDEAFFEQNTLMLVFVGANSGSYRFGVREVYCSKDAFCINVEQTNSPDIVTEDMAGWFITVAVPDSMIESCTEFDAVEVK